MAAGSTYTHIQTTTLNSSADSVTFNSIPGTYTDLILSCWVAGTGAGGSSTRLRFNSDTGNNYSSNAMGQQSINKVHQKNNNTSGIVTEVEAGTYWYWFASYIFEINNYASSSMYKPVLGRSGIGLSGGESDFSMGLWRNTNAITSITVYTAVNNFTSGCNFSLYGITAA